MLSDCDIKPEVNQGGNGGTIDGEIVVQSKISTSKPFMYQDSSGDCKCGSIETIFACDENGILDKLSENYLSEDCEVLAPNTFSIVEKHGTIPTESQCEWANANFDWTPTENQTITLDELTQMASDVGFTFPSGFPLSEGCIDNIHIALNYCANEKGDIGESVATSADVVVAQPNNQFINLDPGQSRTFAAMKGQQIQGVESFKATAGSIVSFCVNFSNWINVICLSPAS